MLEVFIVILIVAATLAIPHSVLLVRNTAKRLQ